MKDQRKRVAKRLASGLLAGALALGGLALSGGEVSANTPSSPTTNRISGADRYETAAAVARAQLNTTAAGTTDVAPNITPNGLIIASGESWPDALAGAQLATNRRPLLLVKKDSIPAAVSDWIADYKTAFATGSIRVFILGGTNVISTATATAIQSAITTAGSLTPPIITRLAGDDRYATAKAISDFTGITQADDTLVIANGENFPDALSAGSAAAVKGWPLITTPSSGLNASVKAKLDSFVALPGGTKQFVLVGSEAVVPRAIEEYLITTKSVPPANIRRIAGADRYQTNFLVNAEYLLNGYLGSNVALVSGESPWDALGFAGFGLKTNTHLVLTPTAGGNTDVATLAATLSAYNDALTGGTGPFINQRLWVIGGTAAVSNAAKTGYVAASASNLTSTLSCQSATLASSRNVTLVLSGRANSVAGGANEEALVSSISAMSKVLRKNNVVLTGSVSAIADANAVVPGTSRKTYTISLVAPLAADDVISFDGIAEGVSLGTTGAAANYLAAMTPSRSIGSSTCTVAADVTRPTITMRAYAGTGGTTGASNGYIWVSSTEPITVGSGLAIRDTGAVAIGATNLTAPATVIPLGTPSVRGNSGLYYSEFLIHPGAISDPAGLMTAPQMPYGVGSTTVVISASAFVDAAGLSPAVAPRANIVTQSSSPTMTALLVRSSASGPATYTVAPLSVSATGASGNLAGAKGSGYSITVVNQRGLLKPTVAINDTAKTFVITADTGYHTPADVQMALNNAGNSDWTVGLSAGSAATAKLNATVVAASCLASVCGFDTVTALVAADQPVFGLAGGMTISVAGYGAPFVNTILDLGNVTAAVAGGYGDYLGTDLGKYVDTARLIRFNTSFEGTATIQFQAATQGASGVSGLTANTHFVAPATLTVT